MIGWRVIHITEAHIGWAPAAACISRAGRGLRRGHRQPARLQMQACPASSSSAIEDGTAFDARQEFPIPPLPPLEAPEEPSGMHGRSDPVITFDFQGKYVFGACSGAISGLFGPRAIKR